MTNNCLKTLDKFRTESLAASMQTTYESSGCGSGTTMTLRNSGEPSGVSKLMTPFIAPAMRRANSRDIAKLKALLEAH